MISQSAMSSYRLRSVRLLNQIKFE